MAKKKVAKKALKPRVKAGTRAAETVARKAKFVLTMIRNGGNATQAAIEAGYSPKTADQQGSRLLKDVKISGAIADARKKALTVAGLDLDRTLREVARLAYFDIRKAFGPDGELLPLSELDDDTAAGIAGLESEDVFEGRGESRLKVGVLRKLKIADKRGALDIAMKYHGAYEKDHKPIADAISALMATVKEHGQRIPVKA